MVIPGHKSGPAKPLNGIGNSPVVGGNHDPADQTGLGHTLINVLYQGFAFDFDYGFTRETGGIESSRDDCDCGVSLHQTPHFSLTRAGGHERSFGRKVAEW